MALSESFAMASPSILRRSESSYTPTVIDQIVADLTAFYHMPKLCNVEMDRVVNYMKEAISFQHTTEQSTIMTLFHSYLLTFTFYPKILIQIMI